MAAARTRTKPKQSTVNRSVVAVAYDRMCTFEFGVACELFGLPRPELDVPWYDFEVVAIDREPLAAYGGITITAPTNLDVLTSAGTIVLPGWRDIYETPPEQLLDAIRVGHQNGARIMSICSGVFILAATGLLDGHAATTHWRYTDTFAEQFPSIDVRPDVLYVDNGQTLTSAGSAAGLDLGLHLIRRDYGAEIANRVAKRLVLPPHRDGGQAQFIDAIRVDPSDTAMQKATNWALAHLHEAVTVSDLARVCHLTPRTFARRFRDTVGTSPHQWLTHQRVLAARRYLETTDYSIDMIAERAGFGTGENFRHHFHATVLTTPTAYRATFHGNTHDPGR